MPLSQAVPLPLGHNNFESWSGIDDEYDLRLQVRGTRRPKKCDLPLYTRTRLEWIASFLYLYTSSNRPIPGQQPVNSKWISASLAAAHAAQKGPWTARKLREWARAFMKDPKDLPTSPYGGWNRERSILEDADVANEIALHLQSLGK
ncbi:hypothetical protein B0H13DRAFT_2373444 [Mycena leptocephala]|nr:hypothetical protein B0H13DRAFT_2373444 [Mycena leptocephala]